MSSILKALKKNEADKAASRPEEFKMDSEILGVDNSPRFSAAGLIFTSLLLLGIGSGATYLYLKLDMAPVNTKTDSPAISKPNPPAVSSVSDIKTDLLPTEVIVVPAGQQKTPEIETHKPHEPPFPTRRTPAVSGPKQAKAVLSSKPLEPTKALTTTNPTSFSAIVKSAPALRVNGIAFNDGGADSVAMINGIPASNGSMIDGVKIEEIHKNMVRFNFNGERFEIPLGQSNR
jgi:hypothetical protein